MSRIVGYNVAIKGNDAILEAVETFLFKKGFKWEWDNSKDLARRAYLCFFDLGRSKLMHFNTKESSAICKLITLEELFAFNFKADIEVKLNDQYTAVINENGVLVGCQTFSFDKVEELYKAVKQYAGS